MKKIRAAVVGYGNIGKSVVEALQVAPDFEIAGIVRRNGAENKPADLASYEVVKDIADLKDAATSTACSTAPFPPSATATTCRSSPTRPSV